jgi:hypothetical protein
LIEDRHEGEERWRSKIDMKTKQDTSASLQL